MTDAERTVFENKITDAALALAAEIGWGRVTLAAIAFRADIPLDRLYGRFGSKTDVLDLLAQRFDRAAVAEFDFEADAPVRERVFDAAMARFDAMEPHRAGLVAIFSRTGRDPLIAPRAWLWTVRSARWLLELAQVDTAGAAGFARARVFAVILARTGQAWIEDDGGDLSRTMARLDRQLRDVSDFAKRWGKGGRRRASHAEAAGPDPIRPQTGDGPADAPQAGPVS